MSARFSVDGTKLYDSEYRLNVLNTVTEELRKDRWIIGALIVGSGAVGFRDEYSDVDVTVLVEDEELDKVYSEWETRIQKLFQVIDYFKAPSKRLYGFLLDRYLELDISFQLDADLFARKPNWKILFDKRGVIPSLMKFRESPKKDLAEDYERRIADSWYWVIHCVASIQRNQPIKASFFIDTLRDEAIYMAGLNRGLDTGVGSFFEDADKLPEYIKKRVGETYPAELSLRELLRALKAVAEVYYSEAQVLEEKFKLNRASKLAVAMNEYLGALKPQ